MKWKRAELFPSRGRSVVQILNYVYSRHKVESYSNIISWILTESLWVR